MDPDNFLTNFITLVDYFRDYLSVEETGNTQENFNIKICLYMSGISQF